MARTFFLPTGKIARVRFLLFAAVLVALKLALDYCITALIFHQPWDAREYVWSHSPVVNLMELQGERLRLYRVLLLVAAPFAWIGVCLCVQRLRDADKPIWLVAFFFVPVAKWILFALLIFTPSRAERADFKIPLRWTWWPFHGAGPSGAVAVLITTLITTPLAILSIHGFNSYGPTLFIGIPFFMGFLATYFYNLTEPRSFLSSLVPTFICLALSAALFLALAFEGIICLLMATPIIICEAIAGTFVAHLVAARYWRRQTLHGLATIFVLPLLFAGETGPQVLEPRTVTTEVRIAAPLEVVWQHIISFAEIPAPNEWLFRAGVAFPIRATIDGSGVGAIRHCNFSTGSFVEPITIWNEPTHLAFDVAQQPDPLTELSPYGHIDTPHLHGMFRSHRGEFRLVMQSDGSTLLRGTTWYTSRLAPAIYWERWSDYVIHQIHLRVLRHIRGECENL